MGSERLNQQALQAAERAWDDGFYATSIELRLAAAIEAYLSIANSPIPSGGVSGWRCDITGNPVGTDTRMIGAPPCVCQGCRAAAHIETLSTRAQAAEARIKGALLAGALAEARARVDRDALTAAQQELARLREHKL